jgi:hypothetical protein
MASPVQEQMDTRMTGGVEKKEKLAAGKVVVSDHEMEVQAHAEEKRNETVWAEVVQEKGIVPHAGNIGDLDGEDEQEYDFAEEEDEGAVQMVRWLAIARFYSSHISNAKIMFDELSNAWGDVSARVIGVNRYLLEFLSERALCSVLDRGPWTFKGDALIVVRYDGLARMSEIVINSIPLWIRIFDIPVAMLTHDFVNALGAKVGTVLEVGEAVKDFQRVRVDFALANPLAASVRIRVRGRGWMEFMVNYEGVPFFYFCCGRIGHQDRECPDEEIHGGVVNFGKELRASPFKAQAGRKLHFQASAPAPAAKRGLNFSGQQWDKVVSGSGSSSLSAGWRERALIPFGLQTQGLKMAAAGKGHNKVAAASDAAEGLAAGVQKMAVDGLPLHPTLQCQVLGEAVCRPRLGESECPELIRFSVPVMDRYRRI